MRFILRYKYGVLQTKTERIDVNFCENTTQLIEYLEKKVQQSHSSFIVKFKQGKNYLRILSGWKLQNYSLKQGSQLHIQFIETTQVEQKKAAHINNRYLANVLGINRKMPSEIEEVPEKQIEDEEDENFSVRKYLDRECERMLKKIQKKNLTGFLQIFQEIPVDVPEEYLIEIRDKKILLIDQLGEKGWGAIHYAIFCGAQEILDKLLDLDVDVNKCTSDGWLPIQLAIDLKSNFALKKLLQDPTINLNLTTIRGSPIHTAARLGQRDVLIMLLEKQVDITLKDQTGKTAYEVCLNDECKNLLKKYEEKRESYNEYIQGNLPLSLTTIIRGQILKAKRPFMKLKQRYLLIDPFQGSMIRYESVEDYPKKAIQITPLSKVKGIRLVPQQQKSWHMKKQYIYFVIDEPNKEIYACKYGHTAQKWVSNIALAVKFSEQLQKNPHLISQVKRNEVVIEDVEFDVVEKKSIKTKRMLFRNSILSRQSTLSNRSQEANKNQAQNGQKLKKVQDPDISSPQDKPKYDDEQNSALTMKVPSDNVENHNEEFNSIATNKVNFAAFNIIKVLGSGAFGKVFLAKHIATGQQFALKALKKKNLILKKQLKYAIMEANILKQANNPFIINLHYAFQTPHYLYLALDYCSGRDLSFHIAREVTFPENEARFYIAELLLAIEHLHELKIIYRDLKPENILLDEDGHIKLADFGLSKQVENDDKTKSFCGSPAYLSPEMLQQQGVGKQSDLYGIGAVLYELLTGQSPYYSDDIATLYRNIKQGKLKFPKNISENARSLILGLLQRNPKNRLGYKDINEIKEHAFFNSINWKKLSERQQRPPVRPQLEYSEDEEDELGIIVNKNTTKFTDFDYDDQTKKINRLANFSFVRVD